MMTELQTAINRSISQDKIVRCEFAGHKADLVAKLSALYPDDAVTSVRENDGTIDVWGGPEGGHDMDWRLRVTIRKTQQLHWHDEDKPLTTYAQSQFHDEGTSLRYKLKYCPGMQEWSASFKGG